MPNVLGAMAFRIIKENKKCFVIIGNARLTEPMTHEECVAWINNITWDKIITVINIILDNFKMIENNGN